MINNEKVQRFIDYNYICFSKKQCIKRILTMLCLSVIVCILKPQKLNCILCFGLTALLISVFFVYLILKRSSDKNSRFLCDGVFYLYISIILNFLSYRVLSFIKETNLWVCLFFFLLLFLFIMLVVVLVIMNIKNDKYEKGKEINRIYPFAFAIFALIISRLFFRNIAGSVAWQIISGCLLLLSFITSIGTLNLLKAYLYRHSV